MVLPEPAKSMLAAFTGAATVTELFSFLRQKAPAEPEGGGPEYPDKALTALNILISEILEGNAASVRKRFPELFDDQDQQAG